MWKVETVIQNHHITTYIAFHDVLHGFMGGSLHRDYIPRCQTYPAVNGHEVGGPVHNIYVPTQFVWHPGQGQINGYPGGVWSGSAVSMNPLQLMVQDDDGGLQGRVLQRGNKMFWGGDPGGPAVPGHFNVVMELVMRHWVSLVEQQLMAMR